MDFLLWFNDTFTLSGLTIYLSKLSNNNVSDEEVISNHNGQSVIMHNVEETEAAFSGDSGQSDTEMDFDEGKFAWHKLSIFFSFYANVVRYYMHTFMHPSINRRVKFK